MFNLWLSEENKDMTQFNNLSINKDSTRSVITLVTGTFNTTDNLLEQDVIEMIANEDEVTISLDGVNLTQKAIFRIFEKVDGANYVLVQQAKFPKDFDGDAISLGFDGKGQDQKITYQADGTLEGAARAIPFSRVDVIREEE